MAITLGRSVTDTFGGNEIKFQAITGRSMKTEGLVSIPGQLIWDLCGNNAAFGQVFLAALLFFPCRSPPSLPSRLFIYNQPCIKRTIGQCR